MGIRKILTLTNWTTNMMKFEELDVETRSHMLEEFQNEEKNGIPYRSDSMSSEGLKNVVSIIEDAIKSGNEKTLASVLSKSIYWNSHTTVRRGDTTYRRKIDPSVAAKTFALTEFNTWYVRGFAKRLMKEGIHKCQIYRAESADHPRCECSKYEGQTIEIKKIYDGHRAKYHPKKNPSAFSVPSGPNCHHTIRRIKSL